MLVADDSSIVRDILERVLSRIDDIQVVGMATNGKEAVALTKDLEPDVVLMDVRMPVMDGIEATASLMEDRPTPVLILSSAINEDANVAFEAIQAGAIDVVAKPTGMLSADYAGNELDLVRRIRLVSTVPAIRRRKKTREQAEPAPASKVVVGRSRAIAIGASTGGPPALASVINGFPAGFDVPVLAVQHISTGFLQGFVEWLDSTVPLSVRVAEQGERLEAGVVYFAPEDWHLGLSEEARITLTRKPQVEGHRPSVDVLFESVAEALGPRSVGVLLTGMGRDGADGLQAMKTAGATTLCQDEESSVVFGMPAAAIELGAASKVLPLEDISSAIVEALGRSDS
ncbi:MAG: chemotaxis-specific protein-glutamate methyltransferase CheB [Acidobacteriota bacterium]